LQVRFYFSCVSFIAYDPMEVSLCFFKV